MRMVRFENSLIELTNFMEVREIQFKLQELLLNAVTESKLFKSINDYLAWSQLTRIELDNLEQQVAKDFGLFESFQYDFDEPPVFTD